MRLPLDLLTQVVNRNTEALVREAGLAVPGFSWAAPIDWFQNRLPFPGETWLLWAVLVAGVGVIAGMAWRLGKGLHAEKDLDRKE